MHLPFTPLQLALMGGVIASFIVLLWPKKPNQKHQKVGLMALETSIAGLATANQLRSHLETTIAAYDLARHSLMAQDPTKGEYAKALTATMVKIEPFTAEWNLCRDALSQIK